MAEAKLKKRRCDVCGQWFEYRAKGRPPSYDTANCRQFAARMSEIMTLSSWLHDVHGLTKTQNKVWQREFFLLTNVFKRKGVDPSNP